MIINYYYCSYLNNYASVCQVMDNIVDFSFDLDCKSKFEMKIIKQ